MRTIFLIFSLGLSLSSWGEQDFRMRAHKLAQFKNTGYTPSDVKAEIDFGRGLAARILNTYPLVDQPVLQKYINTLGSGLASQIGRPELTFYFAVVETMDINAYACPGGYIFLTKGLVKMLGNEAELVGVLAHEIAHVNERHVIKKLKIKGKDDSAISGLGAMIGGATASFRVALKTISDEAMNVLFNDGLMESEELSADRVAIRAMYATGYKVLAYKDLLDKIKKSMEENQAKVLAKTHPKVGDRLKLVDLFEKKNTAQNLKLNEERFKSYAN